MKGKTESETVDKKTDKKPEEKRDEKVKEEKKEELHFCKDCRFYDHGTEREFHRDGIREGLVEIRAICRNPKARSHGHLVKAEYAKRQCPVWEEGVYVKPQKPKKETTKKKGKKKTMKDKEANEYAEKFVKENVVHVPEKSVRRKNNDVVILERKKGKTYVRPVSK